MVEECTRYYFSSTCEINKEMYWDVEMGRYWINIDWYRRVRDPTCGYHVVKDIFSLFIRVPFLKEKKR